MKESLLAATLLLCPAAFAATPHWEYSGEAGPAKWASLTPEFGQCAGRNQSPVNLSGLVKAELAPLQFHYLAGGHSVTNNGHTVQVDYAPGSSLELDGMHFELKQFHFHAPSENLIEGKPYPLEGHLVHANDQGELAVVAVMFEPGKANGALSQVWQSLPAKAGEQHALKEPVSAEPLLPAKRDYYRFSGSLTTPPCSEGVRWLVMKQPVQVSEAQIDTFKAVMHHPNNRPVQPLHGRLVLQ
ncbi:carbonic anhydrase family protein [Aeromonas dhakensis]|uniref:carbonic anhydrase n=1 Tax=Aeromonas dhakensis TaxID=196024 RepID=UPI000F8820E8|nr:carbonic anhydrase family protein [Aeromonas dhakensis]EIM1707120.1 carbonic anhydrase family protein [Aeromonas dhakensis]RUQ16298.1 carbonic anhydrase [Aeromonas dhakensis]